MPSSTRAKSNSTFFNRFCGCFSSRKLVVQEGETRPYISNVGLLPSSAVESLECVEKDPCGDHHLPDKNATAASLPTSVILTNAILNKNSHEDQQKIATSPNRKAFWSSFRRKNNNTRALSSPESTIEIDRGIEQVNISPSIVITGNRSLSGVGAKKLDATSNQSNRETTERLVFSPLPSQPLPEPHEDKSDKTLNKNNGEFRKNDKSLQCPNRLTALFKRRVNLLPPRCDSNRGKKCFVIDLDETLVHSSFKAVEPVDFKVGVEIDGITHRVYVLKRPYVDEFLSKMANLFECVLFTASLAKYADPVADFLDQWNAFRHRLFRESCLFYKGNYVKDLSQLGRPLNQIVILDNSPASYMFHNSHAVQVASWFDDPSDRALLDLIPYFERLAGEPDVVEFLHNNPPPTNMAAVGTVGLPPSSMFPPHFAAAAAAYRHSQEASPTTGIITSMRRTVPAPTESTSITSPTLPTSYPSSRQSNLMFPPRLSLRPSSHPSNVNIEYPVHAMAGLSLATSTPVVSPTSTSQLQQSDPTAQLVAAQPTSRYAPQPKVAGISVRPSDQLPPSYGSSSSSFPSQSTSQNNRSKSPTTSTTSFPVDGIPS